MMMEAEDQSERDFEDAMLMVLKMEEGTRNPNSL